MNIGLIGLGKMGCAIAYRLIKDNHTVFGFDNNERAREDAKKVGVEVCDDLQKLTEHVGVIWLMLPAGKIVDEVIEKIKPFIKNEFIIIDGGNSNFNDSARRAHALKQSKIDFLDCGTSGGLKGKDIGFCLMIGGEEEVFKKLEFVFKSVAFEGSVRSDPSIHSSSLKATKNTQDERLNKESIGSFSSAHPECFAEQNVSKGELSQKGYAYMGPAGAGHYVKMIHNGIEYSILQSYAEGFDLLKNGSYKNLDLEKISGVWKNGSVIRSWILDLTHEVFAQDQELKNISGAIGENATGRWTLDEAEKQNIPMDLLQKSLDIRAKSRETGGNFATKVVAMLRNKFGGHAVKTSRAGDES